MGNGIAIKSDPASLAVSLSFLALLNRSVTLAVTN